MDKMKRAILLKLPTSVCNLRCHYCYLSHRESSFEGEQAKMLYSPKEVAYALRKERIGGTAYLNICADGETLLSKDIELYIYELVKEGHYIEIVTNLTITKVLEKILSWDKDLLKRITFKCSFHYLELKKKNLLEIFADNVNKIWQAGASANIEITPTDELIPYIDEIKEFSLKHFGALPHLSIARNDATKNTDYLTNMPIDEYDRVWSQFESSFWKFKKTIFGQKRKEFCYAGDWELYVDISNGYTTQCYCSPFSHNVFETPDEPIKFKAIGKCNVAHCYNGHVLLTIGCIPGFTDVRYGDIRNRKKKDGGEWIQPEMLAFLNTQLGESNRKYSYLKRKAAIVEHYLIRVKNKIKRMYKNVQK